MGWAARRRQARRAIGTIAPTGAVVSCTGCRGRRPQRPAYFLRGDTGGHRRAIGTIAPTGGVGARIARPQAANGRPNRAVFQGMEDPNRPGNVIIIYYIIFVNNVFIGSLFLLFTSFILMTQVFLSVLVFLGTMGWMGVYKLGQSVTSQWIPRDIPGENAGFIIKKFTYM